jgi:hypothetical protein
VTIVVPDAGTTGQIDKPVWFDPHLLGRVLRHLLENAASHTPPGSRVTLSSKRTTIGWSFCVEDNGPGIDALDLPLIFEKFYRGKRGAKAQGGRILKVHGGGTRLPAIPAVAQRDREWGWPSRAPFCPACARRRIIEASRRPPPAAGSALSVFWVPLIEKEPSRRLP